MTIAPSEVQRIELADELAKLGVPTPVEEAGVDIDYEAPPGSLIGQLVSVDQTGDFSFEVPIKDPSAMNEMLEGAYPWSLEGGMRTALHLKNTTDKSVVGLVTFTFPGGTYNPDRIHLQPYQTVAIDIQKLKDTKKPDVQQKPFPADAMHGQIVWHQDTPHSLIGRAEEVDSRAGIARSFSCGDDCCVGYHEWYGLSPNSASGVVGGGVALSGQETGTFCNGYPFALSATPYEWDSWDRTIATINWPNVSFVGAGNTTVWAGFNAKYYDYDIFGVCSQTVHYEATANAQVNVCDFTLSPTSIRATYCDSLNPNSVTFTGAVRGGCTWQNQPDCTATNQTGTVHLDSISGNYGGIEPQCTVTYFAGPNTGGTFDFTMTVPFYGAPAYSQTITVPVSCP